MGPISNGNCFHLPFRHPKAPQTQGSDKTMPAYKRISTKGRPYDSSRAPPWILCLTKEKQKGCF